ncbi:MAG: biopolymer transporter ExbD [Planctomycetota bacterium]|nr:biopolymer transporter ExbD [Planctomycetota bacterium]
MAIRRSNHEFRVELTPMIDVIFLLLVFFIYAMVLMVRVDLVPMELRSFQTGQPAEPAPAATISIDLDGNVFLDRQPIPLDDLADAVRERTIIDPATVVYLAVAEGRSETDRAPVLQDVWDRLRPTGVTINLVGRPKSGPMSGPGARSAPPPLPEPVP